MTARPVEETLADLAVFESTMFAGCVDGVHVWSPAAEELILRLVDDARAGVEARERLDGLIAEIEKVRDEDRLSRQRDACDDPCDSPHWACHAAGAMWGYDHAARIVAAALGSGVTE